jgi:3-dehydroquinate synthetase
MLYALLLSREVGGMSAGECDRLWKVLSEAQLHGSLPTLPRLKLLLGVDSLDDPNLWPELLKLMGGDKKNAGSAIHWILLTKQGVPYQPSPNQWTTPVSEEILLKVWELFKHKVASTSPGI